MPKVIGYDPVDLGFGGIINYAGIDNNVVLDNVKDGDYPTVVAGDPNWSNVITLLDFSDNGTTDLSNTGVTSAIVGSGVSLSSTVTKFGGNSLYLDGSAGVSYLNLTDSAYAMGTNNWTIEGWFYPTSNAQQKALFTLSVAAGSLTAAVIATDYASDQALSMYNGTGQNMYNSPLNSFTTNNWHHIAVVRSSGTLKLFIDGVLMSGTSAEYASNDTTSARIQLGGWIVNNDRDFIGYIDSFRVTKGVARYTTTFSVPTLTFPKS